MLSKNNPNHLNLLYFLTAIFFLIACVLGYMYFDTNQKLISTKESLSSTEVELGLNRERVADLSLSLENEQAKNEEFSSEINQIMGTVGSLDKLSKIDKELLQKYSKIFFLNEHYVPKSLSDIDPEWIYEKGKKIQIHSQVLPFLSKMLEDAKDSGHNLEIISAYRSFGEQGALKNGYLVTYGSGANTFSADQGYSEHQLGTALDFTTKELGANFTNFEKTESYKWMQENAHKYGFVLSYPKDNVYYQFEPWHWRFVGVHLATRLFEDKIFFYDLNQANINSYLISIFD